MSTDRPAAEDYGEGARYGFTWGQVSVERLISAEFRSGRGAHRLLGVSTDHHKLEIQVSPTGRSVRVFRDGKELK